MVGSQRCSAALRSILITLPQNSGAVAGLTTGLFCRILLITLATLQPIPLNSKFIHLGDATVILISTLARLMLI